MTVESDQILECCDEPAAPATSRPTLEWWDAADRYFMDCLKAHAIALPRDEPLSMGEHLVTANPARS